MREREDLHAIVHRIDGHQRHVEIPRQPQNGERGDDGANKSLHFRVLSDVFLRDVIGNCGGRAARQVGPECGPFSQSEGDFHIKKYQADQWEHVLEQETGDRVCQLPVG